GEALGFRCCRGTSGTSRSVTSAASIRMRLDSSAPTRVSVCRRRGSGAFGVRREGGGMPMRAMIIRLLLSLGIPALAAVTGTAAGADIAVPGLSAPVRVLTDADGVRHIEAANDLDGARAQGFVHCRDRLFQMDQTRRQVDGTEAELLGPGRLAGRAPAPPPGLPPAGPPRAGPGGPSTRSRSARPSRPRCPWTWTPVSPRTCWPSSPPAA